MDKKKRETLDYDSAANEVIGSMSNDELADLVIEHLSHEYEDLRHEPGEGFSYVAE